VLNKAKADPPTPIEANDALWRDNRKSAARHTFWRMSIHFKEAFDAPQSTKIGAYRASRGNADIEC